MGRKTKGRMENKEEKKRKQCMRWVPKWEAGERMGQNTRGRNENK
jgi:hypothetical protein